jgi:hypothetical protein
MSMAMAIDTGGNEIYISMKSTSERVQYAEKKVY